MAVALQLRVLLAALELVRTTARRDPARPAGPPSPSAPHHAAFQKRKSIAGESRSNSLIFNSCEPKGTGLLTV